MPKQEQPDSDVHKGAVEEELSFPSKDDRPNLSGQQSHRESNELIKDTDTDFPEPGPNPEHSGEHK